MARHYKIPRKYSKPRKYNGRCEYCGRVRAFSEVYQRVDDNNIAISYNAPYLCKDCYIERYGK